MKIMKRINYYEKISKYNQDKLKFKLIWFYLSLCSFFLISFFMISISDFSEKESVKTVYIPKKIENNKLNYEKENINIINNGTANITINNYYGDSIKKK